MPLLFAATLFVSASLLFMVQPMVGKMVLPLLGGSPAVWNACMVFFQALLLLGYLYAHKLASIDSPRKQWTIHLAVLALPLTAFVAAAALGGRHTPIAIAESLAPTDEKSPILSVLLILSVAIGVPFFVVSTTATLLQKWFVYTGHPSARDPYFLYAASNVGSLISLLGYPLVLEPRLSIDGQAWVFAIGFCGLAVLIALCGRAANNPIGVPPGSQAGGKKGNGDAASVIEPPAEPPPALPRKLKWIALAFVPSTLMLGVTFHMTTDIASVPLLWVGPLALYLITFIIVFGTVRGMFQLGVLLPAGFFLAVGLFGANPSLLGVGVVLGGLFVALQYGDWFGIPNKSLADSAAFRIVIGNLAPVMILLLVFVMISGVKPGTGIELLLYNLTFFAAALMCHYELARDRPSPKYLTEFFLLMSVGGMLGGVFNSLLAPLVFTHAYEFPIALLVACFMVPKLVGKGDEEDEEGATLAGAVPATATARLAPAAPNTTATEPAPTGLRAFLRDPERRRQINLALDIVLPILVGVGFYFLTTKLPEADWFSSARASVATNLSLSQETIQVILLYAVPVMICFFFVDRPLRFALAVTAILGPVKYREEAEGTVHAERSFFGILKVQEVENPIPIRSHRYRLTKETLAELRAAKVPEAVVSKLGALGDDWYFPPEKLRKKLAEVTGEADADEKYWALIAKHAEKEDAYLRYPEGTLNQKGEDVGGRVMIASEYKFRKLVHGTTLHGTQFADHKRHFLDDFQMIIPGVNPWDAVAVAGAIHAYDIRQEPLTYYHRTGPVGAMFLELRRRKGGADEKAHFAMVGLGTGSASCYALPGQNITFYEIDPAVKNMVADVDTYFNYVKSAERRKAILDIQMGDARLKLKQNTDRKYSLLLVDAFSSDSIPVHLLTVEAVQLYLDRMTDDGMLALHISNKYVKLEPVVAAIANKLGLTARVWNDNAETKRGKTASSWVVLAHKKEDLGELYTPLGDLPFSRTGLDSNGNDKMGVGTVQLAPGQSVYRHLMDLPIIDGLFADYEKELEVKNDKGKSKFTELKDEKDPKAAWLAWIDAKLAGVTDPVEKERLIGYRVLIDKYGPATDLGDAIQLLYGHAFRRLETYGQVHAWTDDYSDVLRVMMIPELQKVRKFFGLETPVE